MNPNPSSKHPYKIARARLEKFMEGTESPSEDEIKFMCTEILNRRDQMRAKLEGRQVLGKVVHNGIESQWVVDDITKEFKISVGDKWVGTVKSMNIHADQRWSWSLIDLEIKKIIGSGTSSSATDGRKIVEGMLKGLFGHR